ncbi:hypothetical protein BHM03_00042663 [Ensete ventricosum]|nr:hypothetical protein BHM03_00042663 [Ensete ventricosum]
MFFLFANYVEFFLIVPCRAEMFNLGKMKSEGEMGSRSVVPSTTSASVTVGVAGSMAEKPPSVSEESSLRKRSKRATPKQLTDASGNTTRVPVEKGKELVEIVEAPERGYTIRELCEVKERAATDNYFTSIMTWLKTVEGEDPLIPRWSAISRSSQVWTEGPLSRGSAPRPDKTSGLHFISALIVRVHDAGRLVRTQHERILALRAANKELKLGANQDLVAAIEFREKGLEEDVKKLLAMLESLKN